MSKKIKNQKGFTIIEALTTLFIFSLITLTFYSTFTIGTSYIIEVKNRLGALALANEKMEIVRNLEYDNIGTQEGIPNGIIPQEEDVLASGKTYHVTTLIHYVDDQLDGEISADSAPNDYKMVKITVSWGNVVSQNRKVDLISNFSPSSTETSTGNGILSINIADSTGAPVSQATVHVVNHYLTPAVNITQETNNNGNIMFIEAPPDSGGYELTVSKSGYETVSTVDPNTLSYTPIDSNASVVASLVNSKSIIIDKLSNLKIKSVDNLGNSISDVSFHIKGGRKLGTNNLVSPSEPIYILDNDVSTNSSGEREINDHSPGQFYLSSIETISGHTLIGVYPILGYDSTTKIYQFTLFPDESRELAIKYADNEANSLLVRILTKTDNIPIQNAQVKLTNMDGYDQTVTTSFDGVAFFPTGNDPLVTGDYSLEVTADGFKNQSSLTVAIDQITNQEIKMIAND